jgi:ABC-type transport system involved in multi-copper enzyme maturation permease subunit
MNLNSFAIQLKNDLWNERYKSLILLFLYLFQAITSIFATFYMEDLLALLNIEFINSFPASGEAALLDFLSDQFLFGILIMSLGTMSIFAADIENNSISFSLTRPISRTEYTTARIIARLIAFIIPFLMATLTGWVFMAIVFEIFPLDRLVWSILIIILLFVYLGTVTSALSTRFPSFTAGLAAIVLFVVQFTLSAFKPLELLSPFTSAALWSNFLINAPIPDNELLIKLFLLVFWIIASFLLAIYSLKTRDL